tara:strand:- start:29 stop:610 length:582 start_codon:yes stop_codon:yes gene_type:complete
MCGRYALFSKDIIKNKFNIDIKVNYNISPNIYVLVLNNNFDPKMMKWGLSPAWSKNKLNIINARSETMYNKSTFKNTYKCIFIADGYYEWKRDKGYKRAFYIYRKSSFLYFAGIYDAYSRCCIVTTKSNRSISHIHHRQPMILLEKDLKSWLENSYGLNKSNNIELVIDEVGTKVNNPMNNNKSIIKSINHSS